MIRVSPISRREALLLGAAAFPAMFSLTACSLPWDDGEETTLPPSSGDVLSDISPSDSSGYAVACECEEATKVGEEILSSGGNAVDAAIAIGYVLGVTRPHATGVGGGGGMVVYDIRSGESSFVDYYDASPSGIAVPQGTTCVPGFVRGMELAAQQWGTRSVSELIQPAIDLAENGFKVTQRLASIFSSYSNAISPIPCFAKDGNVLDEGDTLVQSDLARTLALIRDLGPEGFYGGSVGNDICAAAGFTMDDLDAYQAHVRETVSAACYGCTVHASPAPFGGSMVLQMLKMLEMLGTPSAQDDPVRYLADLSTVTAIASGVRSHYVADPDYVRVDNAWLVSDEFVRQLLETNGAGFEDVVDEEPVTTTAYSVIDANGLMASVTNSLGDYFGSYRFVGGFFLNDHLYFSGLGVNTHTPGKRPRTNMSPCVVLGDSYAFSIGTPGGNRIPRVLSSVLHDILRGGASVQDAIEKNRALFLEGVLYLEDSDERESLVTDDAASSYTVIRRSGGDLFGSVHVSGRLSDGEGFVANDSRRKDTNNFAWLW